MVYLEENKVVEVLQQTQTVNASSGYDGFVHLTVILNPIDIDSAEVFVGDYVGEYVNLTVGSLDKYAHIIRVE